MTTQHDIDTKEIGDSNLTKVDSEPNALAENMQWGQVVEIDEGYLRASKLTKFWYSVLFQMILFGA